VLKLTECASWFVANGLPFSEVITITDRWLKFGRLKSPIGDFNLPDYDHRSRLAILASVAQCNLLFAGIRLYCSSYVVTYLFFLFIFNADII